MSSAPWLKPPEGVVEQHTSALARLCCETSAAILRLRALWCLHSIHILFVLFGFIHIHQLVCLLLLCVCSPLISHTALGHSSRSCVAATKPTSLARTAGRNKEGYCAHYMLYWFIVLFIYIHIAFCILPAGPKGASKLYYSYLTQSAETLLPESQIDSGSGAGCFLHLRLPVRGDPRHILREAQGLQNCTSNMALRQEQAEMNLGIANGKVPPAWCLENDRLYALRTYRRDLELWAAVTDLRVDQLGPAAALRITGCARDLIREIPIAELQQGRIINQGGQPVQLSGIAWLIRVLERRYGASEEEQQITAISELMRCHRNSGESTDAFLARFDLVLYKARDIAGVNFPEQLQAWLTLSHLNIPLNAWSLLLAPTEGRLPVNPQELAAFQQYVRRNGHLHEHRGEKTIAQPFFTFPADGNGGIPPQTYMQMPMHVGQQMPMLFDTNMAPSAGPTYDWHWNYWYGNNGQNWQQTSHFQPGMTFMASQVDDDNISWKSFSTGQSASSNDDEEALDWSDLQSVPADQHATHIYQVYRHHKRRFRKFFVKRKRFKGRKGHGKGKGKKDPTRYVVQTAQEGNAIVLFRGKGNPVAKDGTQLKCHTCGSTDHFKAKCPQRQRSGGKGKHSNNHNAKPASFLATVGPASFLASAAQDSAAAASSSSSNAQGPEHPIQPFTPWTGFANASDATPASIYDGRSSYFSDWNEMPAKAKASSSAQGSRIFFADGSILPLEEAPPLEPMPEPSEAGTDFFHHEARYMVWPSHAYHSNVKLDSGEALVVDTGAVNNLIGDEAAQRLIQQAKEHHQGGSIRQLDKKYPVGGVGATSSYVNGELTTAIALSGGIPGSFRAPVVEQSAIPGLLGNATLIQHRAVIDLTHNALILLGQGGMELRVSPGTIVLPLKRAASGHLMLEVSAWKRRRTDGSVPTLSFHSHGADDDDDDAGNNAADRKGHG